LNIVYSLPFHNETSGTKVQGVAVGLVTNISDPDKLGRVKVKFLVRETEQESDWIRIASPMAGAGRGIFFLPEVNDEVLLAFHNGNVEEPFIIGALWNGKDKPPEAVPHAKGKVTIRKIKSRAGNEIIFSDEENKERLELRSPQGKKLILDDGAKKIQLQDDNAKNSLVIDKQANTIKIESGSKVTIKVNSCTVEVDGTGGVTISAPSGNLKLKANKIDIEATTALSVKANATMELKAGAMMNIKGAMVKIN